jgi:histidine triad (HIT) family protein
MENCIFCKIRDRIIPKEFIYQDKDMMVFPDIHPVRPVHLLIIPKKHIGDLLDLKDDNLSREIKKVIQGMIKKFKLENKGYRVVINGGGAQGVNHLHIHLVGPMGQDVGMSP